MSPPLLHPLPLPSPGAPREARPERTGRPAALRRPGRSGAVAEAPTSGSAPRTVGLVSELARSRRSAAASGTRPPSAGAEGDA
ncbi:hypothetical protein HGI15_01440 [Modestobacter lapidis]|nr:hypothetical protein [Modestobacter lapidis]